jgi:hypothetical protein
MDHLPFTKRQLQLALSRLHAGDRLWMGAKHPDEMDDYARSCDDDKRMLSQLIEAADKSGLLKEKK